MHRGDVDTQALRSATEVLNAGGLVLISPEGTRSQTGGLIQGQEGMAYLAMRTGVPILPVGHRRLDGPEQPISNGCAARRITITVGRPFTLDPGDAKLDRETLRRLTDQAMRQLAAILPEEMRGVYRYIERQW